MKNFVQNTILFENEMQTQKSIFFIAKTQFVRQNIFDPTLTPLSGRDAYLIIFLIILSITREKLAGGPLFLSLTMQVHSNCYA